MADAIGMIETYGLIPSIVAADEMVKSAQVSLMRLEKIDAGIVTIIVQGDVSAVKVSIEAGEMVARKIGNVLTTHVIAHMDNSVKSYLEAEQVEVNIGKVHSTLKAVPIVKSVTQKSTKTNKLVTNRVTSKAKPELPTSINTEAEKKLEQTEQQHKS